MDRWPRTPDDWRGSGSEPGGFGRRNEAGLYGDLRAGQGCGNFPSTPPRAASPASRLPLLAAAREKSISTCGPTARRSRIRPSGLAATSYGNDRLPAGEERLLLSSTDSRLAKPLWSPDGAKLAFLRCAPRGNSLAVAVLNTDGTGDRVLSLPRDVQMIGSDWAKDGQAILGACRFNRSGRYSTCMVPLSIVNERGDSPVQVIASDSKRNLYNQRFSPDQRWITFLAHDLAPRLDVDGLRDTCRRWSVASDDRGHLV